MTETVVTVCDAIHANIAHLPPGQAAGYSTGTGIIPWTAADWAAHPGAVRIDQDPAASDPTADILDVERGAATPAIAATWSRGAAASYASGRRPGQRRPAIYMSRSAVTTVVNALIAGGVTSGVGLWIADWSMTQAQAAAEIQAASGPFPVIAVQYRNAGLFDVSLFSQAWLADVSGHPAGMRVTVPPPGQWQAGGKITAIGRGPEGHGTWITSTSDGKTWTPPAQL